MPCEVVNFILCISHLIGQAVNNFINGSRNGPILFSNVACNQTHLSLRQCIHLTSIGQLTLCDQDSRNTIAGVICPKSNQQTVTLTEMTTTDLVRKPTQEPQNTSTGEALTIESTAWTYAWSKTFSGTSHTAMNTPVTVVTIIGAAIGVLTVIGIISAIGIAVFVVLVIHSKRKTRVRRKKGALLIYYRHSYIINDLQDKI